MNDDLKQLRKKMDANDPFLSGGHQIIKMRRREREVPIWAVNNAMFQKLLLRSFPKLKSNTRQRKQAGRWTRVVHLYYRARMTVPQIAAEMGLTKNTIKNILKGIRRVSRGRRYDNRAPLGRRPRGRPKNT